MLKSEIVIRAASPFAVSKLDISEPPTVEFITESTISSSRLPSTTPTSAGLFTAATASEVKPKSAAWSIKYCR